ncbi:MAG: RES family NAD+ phosphorylase [Actinomycetota bacterium]
MIAYRHADPRFPFLWESENEAVGRWNATGDGPVQYLTDTPDGAWAEFLRHEEITTPEDLATVRRAIWAIDIGDEQPDARPELGKQTLFGNRDSYARCQREARRLRTQGAVSLVAPSAALLPSGASGYRCSGGLVPGPSRDGRVYVLFGARPRAIGWQVVFRGRPATDLLDKVRHFSS